MPVTKILDIGTNASERRSRNGLPSCAELRSLDYRRGMAAVGLREATVQDEEFLTEMLVLAADWHNEAGVRSNHAVLSAPQLALYIQGWGRPGDAGVIAVEQGQPLGAAWYRIFSDVEHGYGFIESAVPELTVAVVEEARNRGVGTSLLRSLVSLARSERYEAISLSVERGNPALRLYKRLGFVRVRRVGNAWTMRLDL
jgi:ribosomal protein S18 acetylase RimI-like enzyme